MFTKLPAVSLLLLLLVSQDAGDDRIKQDLKRMQGTWTMAGLEVDGKDVPAAKLEGTVLTVKDDRYAVKVKDRVIECVLRLDPSKDPKAVDMVFAEPGGGEKVLKGIYQVENDTLKIARGLDAKQERPGQFATWPGTTYFVVTWKRQAP